MTKRQNERSRFAPSRWRATKHRLSAGVAARTDGAALLLLYLY